MEKDSFFWIFDFSVLMHDAIDCGLVYEDCTITRDITTSSGLVLKKGTWYESVWFLLGKKEFQFIKWKETDRKNCYDLDEKESVIIPQDELSPFCNWDEKNRPEEEKENYIKVSKPQLTLVK